MDQKKNQKWPEGASWGSSGRSFFALLIQFPKKIEAQNPLVGMV
jgi:hypothetical protein